MNKKNTNVALWTENLTNFPNDLAYYWLNPGLFGPDKALWGLFSTPSVKFDPDILEG